MEQRALLALQSEVSAWRIRSQEEELLESDSNDDEWWRGSTCSSCSDSEYDGCLEEVNSKGELFYIECMSQTVTNTTNKWKTNDENDSMPRRRRNWKKGAQGTLMKLVQRHRHQGSKKGRQRSANVREDQVGKRPVSFQETLESHSTSKVTFHDNRSGEIREVHMYLEPKKHNLGRRASLCETLLGLVPGHFSLDSPDDQRIMVAGFIPDTEATRHQKIKIGDWLHSIDGQQVSHQNINTILGTITSSCMVTITLQRIAGCDITQQASPFVLSKGLEVDQLLQSLCRGSASESGGSVVLLSTAINQDQFNEREVEDKDEVLYCYPENPHPPLVSTRGIFITLLHVLSELCQSCIQTSSLVLSGEQMHGIYHEDNNNLVLFAFRKCRSSMLIAKELSYHFMKAVQFSYNSFTRAALEHKSRLDLLVDCLFKQYSKLVTGEIHHIRHIIPMAQILSLPRETQTDLDNTLAELASADFDNKSSSRQRTQRNLFVLGSCLLYKGLTVCTQLPMGLLPDLQSFCWLHGLNALDVEGAPLRRMIAWKQVYVSNYTLNDDSLHIPPTRHYVLLLGQNHYTLAVLFEARQNSQRKEETLGPPIEYVEQAQISLDTILHLGIADVIETWLKKQLHSLVGESVPVTPNKLFSSKATSGSTAEQLMRNLRLNTTEQNSLNKSLSNEGSLSLSSLSYKSQKATSVIKQQKISTRSSENSEDTCSQSASEGVQRANSDTSSEDSWNASQESGNQYDTSLEQYRTSLQGLPIPTKLVEGPSNCFLHYITLESNLGIILSSDIGTGSRTNALLSNFHTSCITLQIMLHESKKNIKRPWMNQSVAATTEMGVMFECIENESGTETSSVYWVVGRHLYVPHPREIYVCYEESISLSLVELAFRLALTI